MLYVNLNLIVGAPARRAAFTYRTRRFGAFEEIACKPPRFGAFAVLIIAQTLTTAAFAVGLAASGLVLAVVLSSVLTLSVVQSTSMQPTIEPGDVILVEKLSPRLGTPTRLKELVFFEPPEALQAIVREREAAVAAERLAQSGRGGAGAQPSFRDRLPQPSSRLFVKRVVGRPGDEVSVGAGGEVRVQGEPVSDANRGLGGPAASLLRPKELGALAPDEVFVLGDNPATSVDSRCWGALPQGNVAGRPLLRVAPMARFGMVK